MKFRYLIVCVLVITSGCTSFTDQNASPTDTVTETTEPATTESIKAFFKVNIQTEDRVNIRVKELESQDLVLNKTYTSKKRVDIGQYLEAATDYRIVIHTNGTVQWNKSVQDYEGYELRVEENGTVTVVNFFES
ncbi:hypothetical protein ACOZ4L_16000 (plasmid) [Haloplanus ruber]|uniref:Lipoprotein n=1 Tax=Haloplanus ruber TaxID=869892 RepID=A0ABD6D3Z7_9EURY|nr:hypothetical protein [Haloplanus ruber]